MEMAASCAVIGMATASDAQLTGVWAEYLSLSHHSTPLLRLLLLCLDEGSGGSVLLLFQGSPARYAMAVQERFCFTRAH